MIDLRDARWRLKFNATLTDPVDGFVFDVYFIINHFEVPGDRVMIVVPTGRKDIADFMLDCVKVGRWRTMVIQPELIPQMPIAALTETVQATTEPPPRVVVPEEPMSAKEVADDSSRDRLYKPRRGKKKKSR